MKYPVYLRVSKSAMQEEDRGIKRGGYKRGWEGERRRRRQKRGCIIIGCDNQRFKLRMREKISEKKGRVRLTEMNPERHKY
jgi:hypothetical protein